MLAVTSDAAALEPRPRGPDTAVSPATTLDAAVPEPPPPAEPEAAAAPATTLNAASLEPSLPSPAAANASVGPAPALAPAPAAEPAPASTPDASAPSTSSVLGSENLEPALIPAEAALLWGAKAEGAPTAFATAFVPIPPLPDSDDDGPDSPAAAAPTAAQDADPLAWINGMWIRAGMSSC